MSRRRQLNAAGGIHRESRLRQQGILPPVPKSIDQETTRPLTDDEAQAQIAQAINQYVKDRAEGKR